MNRIWVAVLMFVLPLIFTLKVSGQVVSSEAIKTGISKEPRFSASIGLGNAYGFTADGLDMSFSNSKTTSLKVGYSLSKYFEVLAEKSNLAGFSYTRNYDDGDRKEINLSFSVTSLNLKAGIPFTVKKIAVRPYFTLGIIGENKLNGETKTNYGYYKSYTASGKTSKIGFGLDVVLSQNVFLYYEVNRWKLYTNLKSVTGNQLFETSQTLIGIGAKF